MLLFVCQRQAVPGLDTYREDNILQISFEFSRAEEDIFQIPFAFFLSERLVRALVVRCFICLLVLTRPCIVQG